MPSRCVRRFILLALFAAARATQAADDPCTAFKWDVARERVLFATAAEAVKAGADVASAPLLIPDRLYELAMLPHQQVTFQVPPGKARHVEGASAGLARLRLPTAGEYRIALDQSYWIDVVDGNHLVAAGDFQGRPGCQAPHKIVLYSLPGGDELTLQLSGPAASAVRLTIVPMPPAHPGSRF